MDKEIEQINAILKNKKGTTKNLYTSIGANGNTIEEDSRFLEQQILKKLGAYVTAERTEKHLSIEEIHRRSHVSSSVISDLENAKTLPKIEIIMRIALALEIDINNIFKNMMLDKMKFFNINNIKTKKSEIMSTIASFGYTKSEAREISDFMNYIEHKRTK